MVRVDEEGNLEPYESGQYDEKGDRELYQFEDYEKDGTVEPDDDDGNLGHEDGTRAEQCHGGSG